MGNSSVAGAERRICKRKAARGRIRITCQKGTLDLGPNLAVAVLDVSESGLRLMVKVPLNPGESVCLGMEAQGHLKPVKRIGVIAWCVPADKGAFQVGINLVPRLEYADVYKMT